MNDEPLRPDAVDPAPSDGELDLSAAFGTGAGGFDLGGLIGAAQEMSAQLAEAQAEIAATVVEGSSGGGMVSVTLDGGYGVRGVSIDASVVDPGDIAMLEDLVLAAFRDAVSQVAELQTSADPMAGLDLGSLGGLFGS